jgi:hypothetical protein
LRLAGEQEQFTRIAVSRGAGPGAVTARGARVQPLDEHDVGQGSEDGTEHPVKPSHEVTSAVADDNTIIPYWNDR